MQLLTLNVEGMSCKHCSHSIMKALLVKDGITEVAVELEKKLVIVKYTNTQMSQNIIKNIIETTGYVVTSTEEKNV